MVAVLRFGLGVALTSVMLIASAQDKTIKVATQNPTGHPIVLGLERFAEIVASRSAGHMKVLLFPGGTLGSDQAMVSALQVGTLEMASLNSGILASQIKAFAVFDIPFLFDSRKQAYALLDGRFGQRMHQSLLDKGLLGLAYYDLGFRQITNSLRPVRRVADLEGMKLRVIPNAINIDWVTALGARPVPMAFSDVYGALKAKAVDGQENPVTVIEANRLFEVQKYLLLSKHQYNPQSLLISKKVWESLDAKQRKILADAARESAVYERQQSETMAGLALERLKMRGMEVETLNESEMQLMRDRLRPVKEKYLHSIDPKIAEELKQAQDAVIP